MAMKFREGFGWRDIGERDVIGENQVGWHADTLYFPNVSSCSTITFLIKGGGMVGVHLTIGDTIGEIGRVLTEAMQRAGGGSHVSLIVHAGRLNDSMQGGWSSSGDLKWPKRASAVHHLIKAQNVMSKYLITAEGSRDIRMTAASGTVTCHTRARVSGAPFPRDSDTQPWAQKTLAVV